MNKRRRVTLAGGGELVGNGAEIRERRAVRNTNDGKDFAVGLKVFPRARWGTADDELEAEVAGVPGLVGEGRLLVLGVERGDGGEGYGVVADQH